MKGMATVKEFDLAPPAGKYPAIITAAEPTSSNKTGADMIEISAEIAEGQYKGFGFKDYLITDGAAKGASIAKKKLRDLGINEVDTDAEIDDEVICQRLTGKHAFVLGKNEQQFTKDDKGDYTKPAFNVDPNTGKQVKAMKFVVDGWSGLATATTAHAPQQGFAAPAQAQQFAPQSAPVQQPAFPPAQTAQVPWQANQPAAPANGAAPAASQAPTGGGRRRRLAAPEGEGAA